MIDQLSIAAEYRLCCKYSFMKCISKLLQKLIHSDKVQQLNQLGVKRNQIRVNLSSNRSKTLIIKGYFATKSDVTILQIRVTSVPISGKCAFTQSIIEMILDVTNIEGSVRAFL